MHKAQVGHIRSRDIGGEGSKDRSILSWRKSQRTLRRGIRRLTDDGGALRTQSFYLFDDRLAEVVAGLADDEERILRAAGCREVAAVVLYQVEQRIFVQIVVVETDRQVGRLMSEETCHHIVFAIIIKYIGHIAALLQHVAAAGEIVGPCSGLFSPRLMAVEPLSVEV